MQKDAADEFFVPGAEKIVLTGEEDINTEYLEAAMNDQIRQRGF